MINKYSYLQSLSEMSAYFKDRTTKHIASVQEFFSKLAKHYPFLNSDLVASHDADKFSTELIEPYVYLTWKYHVPEFQYPVGMGEAVNKATLLHVLNNKHHPEFYDPANAKINEKDRDAPSGNLIDASAMPKQYLAEMCSDWAAVAKERGEGSPRGWADKNVNVRWAFTTEQVDFISNCIEIFE